MSSENMFNQIAVEAEISVAQVSATATLLREGAGIPFIARYRKDVTGGLTETQVETIADRLKQEQDLEQRRRSLIDALEKQGAMNESLREQVVHCTDRFELDDIAAAVKKPKNTKSAIAVEKGLRPLADYLFHQALLQQTVPVFAETFVSPDKSVSSVEEALEGAQHILAERIASSADARQIVRSFMLSHGKLTAHSTKNADGKKTKYEAYYTFSESPMSVNAHQLFALTRGADEGMLRIELTVSDSDLIDALAERFIKEANSPFDPIIRQAIQDAYNRTLRPALEKEIMTFLRRRAEDDSLAILRENARSLLLSPHAGDTVVLGIDPGGKAHVKVAALGAAGAVLETAVISLTPDENTPDVAAALLAIIDRHSIKTIAVGHGSNGRDIQIKIRKLLRDANRSEISSVIVNDAGASAYAASKEAKELFPDCDSGTRVAITIGRRFQDPLAELAKMDPRHIGFGQYHHEVNQGRLRQAIERTLTSCISNLGLDVNTASAALLSHVCGLNTPIARAIVEAREKSGPFASRQQLLTVDGMTPKIYEYAVGFLRVSNSENSFDQLMIHPEAYDALGKILDDMAITPENAVAKAEELAVCDLTPYAGGSVGVQTLNAARHELLHGSREARTQFRPPRYAAGVTSVNDLRVGLETEGIVSNVTDFGAFVDIGVEQDGLVHISQVPQKDGKPAPLRVGDVVRVRVVKVDKETPRISLTMRIPVRPQRERGDQRPRPARDPRRPVVAAVAADGQPAVQTPPSVPRRADRLRTEEVRRPAQAGDKRPSRDKNGRDDRHGSRDKGRQRPGSDRQPSVQISGNDSSSPLNTLLAEQLAALKDRFQS